MTPPATDTQPELEAVRPPAAPRGSKPGDYLCRLAERAQSDAEIARVLIERESLLDRITSMAEHAGAMLDTLREQQVAVENALRMADDQRHGARDLAVRAEAHAAYWKEIAWKLERELESLRSGDPS